MRSSVIPLVIVGALVAVSLASCQSSKQSTTQVVAQRDTSIPPNAIPAAKVDPRLLRYTFYFKMLASDTHPADEIFIDTSGQMRFNTHQQMKSGIWKTPTGFAYIEPADDDTLTYFVRKESLFVIDPSDVSPECPNGDIMYISFYRPDLKKEIRLKTNTCAEEYNLLTGEQRKLFPMLLAYVQRLAQRYRPLFPDSP
ncbi:MAG: hypothetical protein JSS75_05165 [Bacteroidetes bacterium]|nr:hypothetical protein [Bacteroidota bacterium]